MREKAAFAVEIALAIPEMRGGGVVVLAAGGAQEEIKLPANHEVIEQRNDPEDGGIQPLLELFGGSSHR